MTEIYGHFVDAVEEVTLPLNESNLQEQELNTKKQFYLNNSSLLGRIFNALESINHSQLDSSESLISLASQSSFNSLLDAEKEGITPKNIFEAFQTIALNESSSNQSLSTLEINSTSDNETNPNNIMMPTILKQLMFIFDEFMHNHSYLEEIFSKKGLNDSNNNNSGEFPKMC